MLDLEAAGSVSPDPKDIVPVSPDLEATGVSPKAAGSVSPDPKDAVFVSPKVADSVSPDLEDVGSVSSDGDPCRHQPL